MSLMRLLEYVTAGLKTHHSLTMDAEEFYKRSGSRGVPLTRETANNVAAAAVTTCAAGFASSELFQRQDTKEILMFMIFARTKRDWNEAMIALQLEIMGMTETPSHIDPHIVVEHPHK